MRQRKSWYGRTDIGQRLPFVALNRHGEGERSPPRQRQGVAKHKKCRKPKVEMKAECSVDTYVFCRES